MDHVSVASSIESRGWPVTMHGMGLYPKYVHPRARYGYCEFYKRNGPPLREMFRQHDEEAGRKTLFFAYTSINGGPLLYAAESSFPGAGIGLFTSDDVEPISSPIIYYTGEKLDEQGVRERYGLDEKQSINEVYGEYLAALDGIFMDAANPEYSGIARLINHQPSGLVNCKTNKYGGIIPIKRIPAHTELSFTYHGRWQKFLSASSVSSDAVSAPRKSSNGRR